MKTKKSSAEPKPQTSAPVEASEAVEVEKVNRISIPLTNDGQIDYERMHGKTREKVKQLIGVQETKNEPAQVVEVFDPSWTGTLYDSIGKLEAIFAGKMLHVPPDIADKCFAYTLAEKEKLAAPTAKVINKYAATWMVQFKDEIALAMLLITVTTFKFQMASLMTQQRIAQEKAEASARSSSPAPDAAKVQSTISELEKDLRDNPPS